MKIKVRPEDFRVEELLQLRLTRQGRYSIYRMEKRGWDTMNVLDYVGRKHRLGRLSRAGLKDRYSVSAQYVSTERRGPEYITGNGFSLKHIGFSAHPVTRDLLLGNRFEIVVRDLTHEEVRTAQTNLPKLQNDGFANYYDEQRFGSSRIREQAPGVPRPSEPRHPSPVFVVEKLIQGDFEGALRLYMATPVESDDPEPRRSRELIEKCWGNWSRCLKHAKPEFVPVLNHLRRTARAAGRSEFRVLSSEFAKPETRNSKLETVHPDFEGAVRRIRPDLLGLFITSFQSFIWNETLAELIRGLDLPAQIVRYRQGEMVFFTELNPVAWRFFERHEIPVVSPELGRIQPKAHSHQRTAQNPDSEAVGKGLSTVGASRHLLPERITQAIASVLRRQGVRLNDLRLPFNIEGLRFKPYTRPGIVVPRELRSSEPQPDELHHDRQKLELAFELPPGSFATILIRRLFLNAE